MNNKMWHRLTQYRPLVEALWSTLSHTPLTKKTTSVLIFFIAISSTFRTSFLWKFFHLSSIYHLSFIPYNPKTNQHPTTFAMQQQRTAGSQRRPSLLFHEVTSASQVVLMTEIPAKRGVQTVSLKGGYL